MNRQEIIDACHAIRSQVGEFGADQDNATWWHWDRAFWYATRALRRLGIKYNELDLDEQIEVSTRMMEKYP